MIQFRRNTPKSHYEKAAEDPDYTVYDAIEEYMAEYPLTAIEVGTQYFQSTDAEYAPMNWEEFEKRLDRMSPKEAFEQGVKSTGFDRKDRYIVLKDTGGYRTLPETSYRKMCVELGRDQEFVNAVISGRIRIPKQMADVVSLFTDRRDLAISYGVARRVTGAGRRIAGKVRR